MRDERCERARGDLAATVEAQRDLCHGAHHRVLARGRGGEVAQGPEHGHGTAVGVLDHLEGLHDVGVAANDRVDAGVGEDLRPAALVVARPGGVLYAPVREGQDRIGARGAGSLRVLGDPRLVQQAYGPGLRQGDAVGAIGVVEHGDAMPLALDQRNDVEGFLAVGDAGDQDLGVCGAPVRERGLDARHALVEGMVGRAERDVKARGDLGVADLLRAVERGIAGEAQPLAAEDGLLADDGHVRGGHVVRHLGEEVVVGARAVRAHAALPDALVHEDVADREDGELVGRRLVEDGRPLEGVVRRSGHLAAGAARKGTQAGHAGEREELSARERPACHGASPGRARRPNPRSPRCPRCAGAG